MIIAITGRLEVGKTSFANFLVDAFSDRKTEAQIVPLAQPLKRYALNMGWNGKKDEKGRRLLQLLGKEVGRDCIHEDIWINKWTKAANRWLASDVWVIADDLRFDNEAQRVQDMGGIIIEVKRPRPRRSFWDWICGFFHRKHASERGIDATFISDTVDNAHDLEHLETIAAFVADILIKMEQRK